jgi:hypothetical protein
MPLGIGRRSLVAHPHREVQRHGSDRDQAPGNDRRPSPAIPFWAGRQDACRHWSRRTAPPEPLRLGGTKVRQQAGAISRWKSGPAAIAVCCSDAITSCSRFANFVVIFEKFRCSEKQRFIGKPLKLKAHRRAIAAGFAKNSLLIPLLSQIMQRFQRDGASVSRLNRAGGRASTAASRRAAWSAPAAFCKARPPVPGYVRRAPA